MRWKLNQILFDVPQRIVELACHTDWQDSLTFFGPLAKVGERLSEDVNAARLGGTKPKVRRSEVGSRATIVLAAKKWFRG